jgi:hypothetical protein
MNSYRNCKNNEHNDMNEKKIIDLTNSPFIENLCQQRNNKDDDDHGNDSDITVILSDIEEATSGSSKGKTRLENRSTITMNTIHTYETIEEDEDFTAPLTHKKYLTPSLHNKSKQKDYGYEVDQCRYIYI